MASGSQVCRMNWPDLDMTAVIRHSEATINSVWEMPPSLARMLMSRIENDRPAAKYRMITPAHYMILSAALFVIGMIGVLVRRNIIVIFMSIELILNAVNINLVTFSTYWGLSGQVFALFTIAIAAAEVGVGLAIVLLIYRNRRSIDIDELDELKG